VVHYKCGFSSGPVDLQFDYNRFAAVRKKLKDSIAVQKLTGIIGGI
jgi:hypothetical protein